MKILHVHNYHAGRGGMEVIFDYTTRVLRDHGHDVVELTRDSADLTTPLAKLGAFASGVYSPSMYRQTQELISAHQPDLAYVHNLFPMLSTSVLDACHDGQVPVVMNIQDFKLTCPMARHQRNGRECNKCLDGSVIWSAVHACKGGRVESLAYAVSHGITRFRQPYHRHVDLFVTPAHFMARYLAKAGIDPSKIAVVRNMCDLPASASVDEPGGYAAFVGRVSPEKGVNVLIEAARSTGIPTRIAGTGGSVENLPQNVSFVGGLSREQLPDFYRNARFLVVPSVWDEPFAVVAAEAVTLGIPVIASQAGGLAEVFEDGISGIYVRPKDPIALANAMRRLWDDPALCQRMGQAGRQFALSRYTPEAFHQQLIEAFGRARKTFAGSRSASAPPNVPGEIAHDNARS